MLNEKNPDYKPKIETKTIRYLHNDYELKLEDLTHIKIEFDPLENCLDISFDKIYIENNEELIKINWIKFTYYYFKFNYCYEGKKNSSYKPYNIILSEELKDYFMQLLNDTFEKYKDKLVDLRKNRECITIINKEE